MLLRAASLSGGRRRCTAVPMREGEAVHVAPSHTKRHCRRRRRRRCFSFTMNLRPKLLDGWRPPVVVVVVNSTSFRLPLPPSQRCKCVKVGRANCESETRSEPHGSQLKCSERVLLVCSCNSSASNVTCKLVQSHCTTKILTVHTNCIRPRCNPRAQNRKANMLVFQ